MVKQDMKSAKTEAADSAAASGRTQLNVFGKFLKAAREKTIPTQHEAARLLTDAGHSASQSLIAQLETGRISNPDASLLKKLAEVYKVSYRELINHLSLDKYGVNDDSTSQLCQDLMGGEMLATAMPDPMAAHRMRSKLKFFKHSDVLDVEAMAEWQKGFPDLKDYWVIAPDFVDDRVEVIRTAVLHNLERDVNITYFVREGQEEPGGRFHRFRRKLQAVSEKAKAIRAVPVPDELLRWLVADMVVANPDVEGAVGYLVVHSEGAPAFGVRMSGADVAKTVDLILPYAAKKAGDDIISVGEKVVSIDDGQKAAPPPMPKKRNSASS
jgi:transcriptional regulator with XRE-family HTH domain